MEITFLFYLTLIPSVLSLCVSLYILFLIFSKNQNKTISINSKIKPSTLSAPTQVISKSVSPRTINNTKNKINEWNLELIGKNKTGFDIHIEWSDGSEIKISDIVPINKIFRKDYGIFPIKVVGISPKYDHGIIYSWKLNGFHWS